MHIMAPVPPKWMREESVHQHEILTALRLGTVRVPGLHDLARLQAPGAGRRPVGSPHRRPADVSLDATLKTLSEELGRSVTEIREAVKILSK